MVSAVLQGHTSFRNSGRPSGRGLQATPHHGIPFEEHGTLLPVLGDAGHAAHPSDRLSSAAGGWGPCLPELQDPTPCPASRVLGDL